MIFRRRPSLRPRPRRQLGSGSDRGRFRSSALPRGPKRSTSIPIGHDSTVGPTANVAAEPGLLVPLHGIYAGSAAGHRAAISIGTNPHYGGSERRVEAFLLDFEGDLYGQRLIVELWERLRDEQSFESEQALIDQIARDVERTRAATRP